MISPEQAVLLQKEVTELRGLTVMLNATIAELKAQLALMQQKYFGGGQGETLDKAQLLLAMEQIKPVAPVGPTPHGDHHLRAPGRASPEAHAAGGVLRAPARQGDDRARVRRGTG